MRHWHRWMGIGFALFMLVIGVTGVAVQVLDSIGSKESKPAQAISAPAGAAASVSDHGAPQAGVAVAVQGEAAEKAPKRPKMTGLRAWSHWLKDIHSGKEFGPVGTIVSILSGVVLIFFSVSGAWMYWTMFTKRKAAGRNAFFWKR